MGRIYLTINNRSQKAFFRVNVFKGLGLTLEWRGRAGAWLLCGFNDRSWLLIDLRHRSEVWKSVRHFDYSTLYSIRSRYSSSVWKLDSNSEKKKIETGVFSAQGIHYDRARILAVFISRRLTHSNSLIPFVSNSTGLTPSINKEWNILNKTPTPEVPI